MTKEDLVLQALADSPRPLTVREIGDAVGLKSPGYVHSILARMEERGMIKQVRGYVQVREP